MKKYFLAMIALGCLTNALQAQTETLFGNTRVRGAFAAPIVEWGLKDGIATAGGGGAAIVLGNGFLGAYGMGSTDFREFYNTGNLESLRLAHGGLWIGSAMRAHKLIHLYGSARIGWGVLDVDLNNLPGANQDDYSDEVFVLTPEIGLELNVSKWLRINSAVGYRHVGGIFPSQSFSNNDLRGPIMSVTARIGWFGNGPNREDRW